MKEQPLVLPPDVNWLKPEMAAHLDSVQHASGGRPTQNCPIATLPRPELKPIACHFPHPLNRPSSVSVAISVDWLVCLLVANCGAIVVVLVVLAMDGKLAS